MRIWCTNTGLANPTNYPHDVGLASTVYTHTIHDRVFGNFPAENTVYTPHIHGFGHPYTSTKWPLCRFITGCVAAAAGPINHMT
jgi:hypothetical protein